jgi:hypothetical protein
LLEKFERQEFGNQQLRKRRDRRRRRRGEVGGGVNVVVTGDVLVRGEPITDNTHTHTTGWQ